MFVILSIFLLSFGVLTSIEDIKTGKIRNKLIIIAVAFALLWKLFINTGHVNSTFLNAGISLAIGFAFWHFRLWTAGDAKLFFAYSLLVPFETYQYGYLPYFPSLVILINALAVALAFLFTRLMLITDIKEKINAIKNSLRPKELGLISLYFFGILWGLNSFFSLLGVPLNFSGGFLLTIGAIFVMRAYSANLMLPISVALSILRVLIDSSHILTAPFLVQFVLLLFIFVFLLGFITNLGKFMFTRNVRLRELAVGMVPTEIIFLNKDRYEKSKSNNVSKDRHMLFSSHTKIGQDQIKDLLKLHEKGKLSFDSLEIQTMLPFAPILFIGVVITLVFSGSFIDYAKINYFCPDTGMLSDITGVKELVLNACKITYY